jgi:hypothetical protein
MSDNEESDNLFLELFEEVDRACDGDVRAYYNSLTPESIGLVFFTRE